MPHQVICPVYFFVLYFIYFPLYICFVLFCLQTVYTVRDTGVVLLYFTKCTLNQIISFIPTDVPSFYTHFLILITEKKKNL